MIILGLDPGIALTGFGLIDPTKPSPFIRCGCLVTPAGMPLEDRLVMLGQDLQALILEHRPEVCVIESVFFGNNKKTAMLTAQARGVLLYILKLNHIEIQSLTPLQIKSRLTGYGAADKQQVQRIVKDLLKLPSIPKPDDAADALAAALSAT